MLINLFIMFKLILIGVLCVLLIEGVDRVENETEVIVKMILLNNLKSSAKLVHKLASNLAKDLSKYVKIPRRQWNLQRTLENH